MYEAAYLYMKLLVDDINILGGRVGTVKKNTEGFVVASKEIGLE